MAARTNPSKPQKVNNPAGGQNYRIFVGAFPDGEIASHIQAIRQQYDPKTARITPPHVTLAGTYWRRGAPTPQNEADAITRLQALKGKIQPFELLLGGIRSFPPADQPVIYLGVEANEGLFSARQALLEILGPDKHSQFSPHLTLAMRLSRTAAQDMLAKLHGSPWDTGSFSAPITELRLMQRGPSDPAWRTIMVLPLG